MGIETAAIVVAAVSVAASTYAGVQQNKAQKKAAGAQEEAAETASAQQKNQEMEARREQVRRQRIQAAQIQQAASNQGVASSSGEFGSLSALSTNVGANLANMSSQSLAAQGIGNAQQQATNFQGQAQQWGMYGQVAGGLGSLALTAGTSFAKSSTTKPAGISQAIGTPTGHN